jgi:glucosylceramidase
VNQALARTAYLWLLALPFACSSSESGGGEPGPTGGTSVSPPTSTGGAPSAMGGSPSTNAGTPSTNAGTPGASGAPVMNGGSGGSAPTPTGGAPGGNPGAGGSGGSPDAGGAPSTFVEPELVTSEKSAYWKVGTLTEVASGSAGVTVNESSTFQKWDGFGGTFNEVGWAMLQLLSESDRKLAIDLLFGVDGARFAFGRVPIGSSDYGLTRYTLNEKAGDYAMESFSIEHDKGALIPYIQAALAVKPNIRFWASPWTPPAWLKTNNSTDAVAGQKPPYDDTDGLMNDDDTSLEAFALYLTKFVQEYEKLGITVRAIHPQNEPGYGNPYPSCYWPSELYIRFIREFLGPTFEKQLPTTEIWGGTMSAPEDGNTAVALSNDAAAMKYVKGFGLQWNTREKVSALKAKNVPVMQTEHKCGNYNFETDYWDKGRYDPNKPQNDYAYAVESWKNIRDWVRAGVNAYSAWNMVLDTLGKNLNATTPWHQNALLVVDRNAKTLIKTPAYYVFRHLSQYVDPMATVVGTTGGDALAFKNPDGSFVVVLYNEGAAKPGMVVDVAGTKLSFDMPANGWATLNVAN